MLDSNYQLGRRKILSKAHKARRRRERKKFPNPNFGKFSDPLTVVDNEGWIVLWYISGLLSDEQLVGIYS